MKTYTAIRTSALPQAVRKYGINERKKTELDHLSIQVLNAQKNVAQYQAIVTSLTEKSTRFQAFLATAGTNKTQAYNNKLLVDQMIQGAADLQSNSDIAFNELTLANENTKILSAKINSVMKKLIYSAEIINKLANLVIRKKALNPLISDELISLISTSGTDANNAVALTLVALQSTFTAQVSVMESETAAGLEYSQSIALTKLLSGDVPGGSPTSLLGLFNSAFTDARLNYASLEKANSITTKQLDKAKASLSKAQVRYKSLQLGLAAANAAALAS